MPVIHEEIDIDGTRAMAGAPLPIFGGAGT